MPPQGLPPLGSNEGAPRSRRRETITGEVYPVEHFLEILLLAQERAAVEPEVYRRKVWAMTIRDIETILADDPLEIVEAQSRLAQRTDPEARRLHARACQLLKKYEAADREAKEAIKRARERR